MAEQKVTTIPTIKHMKKKNPDSNGLKFSQEPESW